MCMCVYTYRYIKAVFFIILIQYVYWRILWPILMSNIAIANIIRDKIFSMMTVMMVMIIDDDFKTVILIWSREENNLTYKQNEHMGSKHQSEEFSDI
jgi:hypothetical protein